MFPTASSTRDCGRGVKPDRHPDSGVSVCGMRENGVSPAHQTLALAPSAETHANVGWANSEPPRETTNGSVVWTRIAVWPQGGEEDSTQLVSHITSCIRLQSALVLRANISLLKMRWQISRSSGNWTPCYILYLNLENNLGLSPRATFIIASGHLGSSLHIWRRELWVIIYLVVEIAAHRVIRYQYNSSPVSHFLTACIVFTLVYLNRY